MIRICDSESRYSGRAHLAQMICFLGPPPPDFLESARKASGWKWASQVETSRGKLCDSAVDFFGDPFFDAHNEFLHPELLTSQDTLHDAVLSLEGKDRDEFVCLALNMLKWIPQQRKTAKKLLDDPWLRVSDYIK